MITLNNSNIDFGFEDESSGSEYSISLSRDTSNFVFRTNGIERMTIMKNGKVGIGTVGGVCDLDINGTINASVYLINGIDISTSAITGDTSNYVRITSNILIGRIRDTSNYVKDTSNILVGSIVYTSNYVRDTSNILIYRVRNTSNYVRITSNILIDRIRDTSNYVKDTSNILVGSIVNTSNYVRDTSNILIDIVKNTSNYVKDTSNILVGRINVTSNYIRDTSNILIDSISDTSNYIGITSNILVGHINNTSNYVKITSNILFGHINNTSNYVKDTSNILVGCINDTSNYVGITSNILVGRIVDTSNYVASTSNILVGIIVDTSNYVEATSNILVRRIMSVNDTSNILVGPINDTSNYIGITSNILVGLINNTCNYTGITNNILVGLINNTCNYVRNTRDNLVSFINSELSTKSQWRYSNNNIYYNAGNAGIGTTNTISKLNIYSSIGSSSLLTLENKQSTFFDISPSTGYTESTTIENNINYKNIIFNAYSTDYPQIQNNIYSPYYAENPSGTTLLAWYKFDGDGNDSSTNNKHLSVISGNPTYSTDLFQGRRYVNTANGSFKLNGGFSLNGVPFSISLWIKTTSTNPSDSLQPWSYIHQGTLGNFNANRQLSIMFGTYNYYSVGYYSNSIPSTAYESPPQTYINDREKWVHILFVAETNKNRKIYRNGIMIHSDSNTSLLNIPANANMYIGSGSSSTAETSMKNRNINISDLRIYSNALTAAQVLQLYNNNIINFRIPLSISVNGSINNVNMGRYMITTSPSNNLKTIMVPLDGQSALTLPSGTSTTVTIKYDMAIGEISGDPPTMIGTTGEYKYLIYTYTTETIVNSGQTQYTINIPAGGIVCDILMVGGGGAGDGYVGSGGGGGAVYYGKNVKINEGTYIINVGRGGIPGVSNGFSTNGFGAIIKGGQTGNSGNSVNIASSAGAFLAITYVYNTIDIVTNSTLPSTNNVSYIDSLPILYNGNTGGKNTIIVNVPSYLSVQKSYQAGGGGGAGTSAKATYYNSGGAEADGGDGVLVDILGVDLYWGGGGGGAGLKAVSGNGGLGGAGSGNGIRLTETSYEGQKSFYRPSKSKELDAAPHTGGGGGGKYDGTATTGGYGGSGIIIIKYLSNSSSSDIELISGLTSDNIIDYKIGNYNNIFKITSFKNGINTDNLVIDSNGYVGIGTLPPNYRLEVSECLATTKRGALDLFIKNKNLGMSSSIINTSFSEFSIINICARFNGSIWITGECLFALNCDIRIKEDIKDINDDSALQMILAVEPKTYKYIDNIENGNKKVYGFIAQQVQKVIPEAVSLENAYIPNIMMLADYNNEVIMLPYIPSKVVIKIKDKIKCYDINNNLVEVEVTEIINNFTFKIKDLDKKYKNNKIFVYGTYVDDFYILSKEYIYTLNVGATQELYRQIKEQDNIIKSREEEINELEKQNKDLNEKYEMLLKELTLIKQRINR